MGFFYLKIFLFKITNFSCFLQQGEATICIIHHFYQFVNFEKSVLGL